MRLETDGWWMVVYRVGVGGYLVLVFATEPLRLERRLLVGEVAGGQAGVQVAHFEVHRPFAHQIAALLFPVCPFGTF